MLPIDTQPVSDLTAKAIAMEMELELPQEMEALRHFVEYEYVPVTPPAVRATITGKPTPRSAEQRFQKNLLGVLKKHGYNVRDARKSAPTTHTTPTEAGDSGATTASGSTASPAVTPTSLATTPSGGMMTSSPSAEPATTTTLTPTAAVPASYDTSEVSSTSMTSTTSSVSSMILAMREPAHGQTTLHLAARKGDVAVVDALLASNECVLKMVNLPDNNGNTALHFAAGSSMSSRRPHAGVITARLLTAGADVHVCNTRGLTPLAVHMLTVRLDRIGVLTLLLEHGADPNTEVDGESVLHRALRRNLVAVSSTLVAFGASLTALNQDGLMCYEVASPRLRCAMMRSLSAAPPYLAPTQRTRCMHCNSQLLSGARVVGRFCKKLVGLRKRQHANNCYHCGFLFCHHCLKSTHVTDTLPAHFVRSRVDDLANVRTCVICEAVLHERRPEGAAPHSAPLRRGDHDARLFAPSA